MENIITNILIYTIALLLLAGLIFSYIKSVNASIKSLYIVFKRDVSSWSLLLANIIVIVDVWLNKKSFTDVMWIYWWQTVIIIIFFGLKAINRQTSTVNNMNNIDDSVWMKIPRVLLNMFSGAIILGMMALIIGSVSGYNRHVGDLYLDDLFVLMVVNIKENFIDNLWIVLTLFGNHLFSFIYNRKYDRESEIPISQKITIGRIIPIFFGLFFYISHLVTSLGSILVFIIIKTIFDLILHIKEHDRIKMINFS